MPKTNADGVPSYADARGTDETATNAAGETYPLDPTVTTDDKGNIVDQDGLTIEGDDADQFETREAREQREQREREEDARRRTDETLADAKAHKHESGDFAQPARTDKGVTSSAGTSSKGSLKTSARTSGSN